MSKIYYAQRNIKHQVTADAYVSYKIGTVVDTSSLNEETLELFLKNGLIADHQPRFDTMPVMNTGAMDLDEYFKKEEADAEDEKSEPEADEAKEEEPAVEPAKEAETETAEEDEEAPKKKSTRRGR